MAATIITDTTGGRVVVLLMIALCFLLDYVTQFEITIWNQTPLILYLSSLKKVYFFNVILNPFHRTEYFLLWVRNIYKS